MKTFTLPVLCAVFVALAFTACVKDPTGITPSEGMTVNIRLTLPHIDNGAAETRAITPTPGEENKIETIDILSFTEKDGYWVYDYTAKDVRKILSGNDMTVTATVRAMTQQQQFVIIVNGSALLASAVPIRYEKMTDIEDRIVCSAGRGEWPAKNNGSATFVAIPMYAKTTPQVVNETNTPIGNYPLIRMVARIDVTLKSSITNFILEEACLFNYKTAGYVAYHKSGFSGDKVSTAAVPASGDHSGDPIKEPTVYYASDKTNNARGEIKYSIYTFESPKITTDADRIKGTALVIGGYYAGETLNKSYYRIDLKTTDDLSTAISSGILRNHSYHVEVQAVKGTGSNSAKDAYLGGVELTAKITKWNDANQKTILDGQYRLTSSVQKHHFTTYEYTVPVDLETDYNRADQGFLPGIVIDESEITYSAGSGWITVTDDGATGDGDTFRRVNITAEGNGTGSIRSARVPVKARNMTYYITITQDTEIYPAAHKGWAGSNIYWDGTKLTFDGVGVTTRKAYQGVYFQWGSLWGVDPSYRNSSVEWSTSHVLYNPYSGSYGHSLDNSGYAWGTWDRVPDIDLPSAPPSGKTYRNRSFLLEVHDPSKGIGDICKYLTETGAAPGSPTVKWRMPTSQEAQPKDNTELVNFRYDGNTQSDYKWASPLYWNSTWKTLLLPDGKNVINSLYSHTKSKETGSPYFPAASCRFEDGRLYNGSFSIGYYWMASPNAWVNVNMDKSSYLNLNDTYVNTATNAPRNWALTVRCVRE